MPGFARFKIKCKELRLKKGSIWELKSYISSVQVCVSSNADTVGTAHDTWHDMTRRCYLGCCYLSRCLQSVVGVRASTPEALLNSGVTMLNPESGVPAKTVVVPQQLLLTLD